MEITRTVKLKIDLPLETAGAFIPAYTAACNHASEVAFRMKHPSSFLDLNREVYAPLRERFGLSAQVAQSCVRVVAARYAAMKKNGVQPRKPVRFNGELVLLQGGERGRDFGFRGDLLSVTTLGGRVKVSFSEHPRLAAFREGWRMGGGYLFIRKGRVYLAVSFSREVAERTTPNDAAIGVDRGLKYVAVATTDGRAKFIGGGQIRARRAHYRKVRASLQSRKAQGRTRSARRAWARFRGKELRFGRDVDHVVSKRIVEFAGSVGCPVIALEDLEGIRARAATGQRSKAFNGRLHRWSFYRLAWFIEYKAEERGMSVLRVDPRHTSQACPRCGHTEQ